MLNSDFKEFVELLNARGVDYLLVGGYALAAHGHPRYTGDIDFWVRPSADNLQRLLEALNDFGFASLGLSARDFDADNVIQLGQPPRRIDLLTQIDGVQRWVKVPPPQTPLRHSIVARPPNRAAVRRAAPRPCARRRLAPSCAPASRCRSSATAGSRR